MRAVRLSAAAGPVDLGGRTVDTWSYGGQVPGPEIRVHPGDTLHAVVDNHLSQPTTVHWHGVELFYPMDGVPALTQAQVPPGGTFTYDYAVPDSPGTYWFHPHVGVQLDRGLYGTLIIEDPHEPLAYDHDWTMVLDDWIDGVSIRGVTATPDRVLATLKQGMGSRSGMSIGSASPSPSMSMGGSTAGMGGMPGMDMGSVSQSPSMRVGGSTAGMSGMAGMGGTAAGPMSGVMHTGASSRLLGGDAGDVRYPFFVINGRTARAPDTRHARPGQRARIRLINAGGDTAFRVALGGHQMQVVHADGYPVQPASTDAVLIGMGERYDVIVTLGDGAFPLVAVAEGKHASALAVIRTSPSAATPPPGARPAELRGRLLRYSQLKPAPRARLAARRPDRLITMTLDGGMARYNWTINGLTYQPGQVGYHVRQRERVQLSYTNNTTMWHPMHLHGHAFALRDGTGPRKDTVIVLPRETVTVQFDATNPGRWMTHCHNIYHAESAMMAAVGYLR
jgi:FtsP/CotA-like multicopper oxidase with cupredoxin domain